MMACVCLVASNLNGHAEPEKLGLPRETIAIYIGLLKTVLPIPVTVLRVATVHVPNHTHDAL